MTTTTLTCSFTSTIKLRKDDAVTKASLVSLAKALSSADGVIPRRGRKDYDIDVTDKAGASYLAQLAASPCEMTLSIELTEDEGATPRDVASSVTVTRPSGSSACRHGEAAYEVIKED